MALLLLCALGAVLPNAGDVPVLEAGSSMNVAPVDGQAWFRILERDYAVLELEVLPGCRLTAFDDAGTVLTSSLDGRLVLSAYSEYWFWILAECDSPVRASLERRSPQRISLPHSGRLGSGVMAEVFTVVPQTGGRYQIRLAGGSSADLDMEIYGPGNRLWAGSYSNDSNEKVMLDILAGEPVTVLVSRYNKGGSGEFTLEMERMEPFRVLDGSVGMPSRPDRIERFIVPARSVASLLQLTFQGDDDLDLLVRGADHEILWSSTTYAGSEMVMLPAGGVPLVAEVVNYPGADEAEPWFVLSLTPPDTLVRAQAGTVPVEYTAGVAPLVGFSPGSEGFYTVSALFEKTRDGDIRLFRRPGEAAILMASLRGDEEFMVWIGARDTVWVSPGFASVDREGECMLGFNRGGGTRVSGEARGTVGESGGSVHYFTARGGEDSILLVKLSGEPRDLDLDMLVSGPGFDLQAEGAESNTDSASDEAVAVSCVSGADYGITVYAYERRAQGSFRVTAENIPIRSLASGTPSEETWAVIVGISGYSDLVDILSRCSMDAMDMREFLLGQGVAPDQMMVLVDQNATRDAFNDALDQVFLRAGPEDRLVIFFSGHGNRNSPGSGGPEEPDAMNDVICFHDGDMTDDDLARRTREFPGQTLLFIDACHSGGFVNDFRQGDNALVVTAAREDLSVSERILTPILLQGSRGDADTDGDGAITAGELAGYVDEVLQRVCPFCDTILDAGSSRLCPGCGEVLKGENRIPRPEQGVFMPASTVVWRVDD